MRNTILSMFAFICILAACKKDPEPSKVVISDTKIWTTVSPSLDMEDVSVFSDIKLIGLHAINWPIHNIVDKSTKGYYKIQLDEVKVYTEAGNLEGDVSTSSDTVIFKPKKCLPANTKIYVQAKAHYETKNDGEKEFSVYMVDGKPAEETYEYSFTTVNFDPYDIVEKITPGAESNINDLLMPIELHFKYNIKKANKFEWNTNELKLKYNYYQAYCGTDVISTTASFNWDSTTITIKPEKSWLAGKPITIKLQADWIEVKDNVSKIIFRDTINLTSIAYNTLSNENIDTLKQAYIDYAYPIDGQCFFLKNEYSKGYMKLAFDIPTVVNSVGYTFIAEFTPADSKEFFSVPMAYDQSNLMLEYNLPADKLKNETIYKLSYRKISNNSGDTTTFYNTYFRTSMFNTFKEKFNSFEFDYRYWETLGQPKAISVKVISKEFFDSEEAIDNKHYYKYLSGNVIYEKWYFYTVGLIRLEIIPSYELVNLVKQWEEDTTLVKGYRDIKNIGLFPSKAVDIYQNPLFVIKPTNFKTNSINLTSITNILSFWFYYKELIMNDFLWATRNDIETDLTDYSKFFKIVEQEETKLKASYILPGGKLTSEVEFIGYKPAK